MVVNPTAIEKKSTWEIWGILLISASYFYSVWLCAQYDSHRDVGLLARQAFEILLPPEKRKRTIEVYRAHIMAVR